MNAITAPPITVRRATFADLPQITPLQRQSIIRLGRNFYSELQIGSLLRFMPMMEPQLISDGTYFVAGLEGRIVACGGWSARAPAYKDSVPGIPAAGSLPAKVRAMYVHPDVARRGIGRTLLSVIETAIVHAGYEEAYLDAILPGVPLYEKAGYQRTAYTHVDFPDGVKLPVVCMHKGLK
jgi:GNAT superfamily N-acetyltransferase